MDFKRWLRSRRIAVLLGGSSAEREISLRTGKAIWSSLRRQGYNAIALDARGDLPLKLRQKRVTFAYLALHGPGGEDGQVQGLLEWLKIPYTGSGVLASALAMDKVASKRMFDAAGLMSAPWFDMHRAADRSESLRRARQMGFPIVVKPASQGSAIGVSIVEAARQWDRAVREGFRFGDTILVEKYLQGPEITIGILGQNPLPIIEIVPEKRAFYDFHAKYAPGGSRHILPARITPVAARRSRDLALAACRALQIRGVARVDLIVDRRYGPALLEINTIPGMTETSLLPDAARAAGISFDELVYRIAEHSIVPA